MLGYFWMKFFWNKELFLTRILKNQICFRKFNFYFYCNRNKMRFLFFLVTSLPLLIGGLIYISCREGNFLINAMLSDLFGIQLLNSFNSFVSSSLNFSSENINSLPSALWVFSTSLLSTRIKSENIIFKYLLICLPLIYSVSLEFIQYLGLTDGTFDKVDLTYSALGWFCALIIAKLFDFHPKAISISSGAVAFFYSILILGNVY